MLKPLTRFAGTWLLLLLMTLTSGCASTVAIDSCAWVQIITYSKDDVLTDQTKREILAHNEAVEKNCSR